MPSIAIVGAGAVGLFYGARLVLGGHEVRFLLRRDAGVIARDGLTVRQVPATAIAGSAETPRLHLPPHRFTVATEAAHCRTPTAPDWIWLAIKTTALGAVLPVLSAIAGPHTRVAVLCNGLGVEDAVADRLGAARVAGMLCFVCLNRQADGSVDHLGHGQVGLGSVTPGGSLTDLAALCATAGVAATTYPSLREARWRKLVWNIAFNGLCTNYGVTTDRVLATPAWRRRAEHLMAETVAAANADLAAAGDAARIENGWIQDQMERTAEMGAYAPSTLLDARAGLPLEIDAVFAEPLRRAQRHGVRAPELADLVARLADHPRIPAHA
jgi:2-dehydropantoate 2-reductase